MRTGEEVIVRRLSDDRTYRVREWDPDGEEANVGALCIWYEIEWDLVRKKIKSEIKDITVSSRCFLTLARHMFAAFLYLLLIPIVFLYVLEMM